MNKGKGKGKGKGKSNIITNKTLKESGDCAVETKVQFRAKRTTKSAAELYRNILNNDNENEEDELLDEEDSDEDEVYGQDDSDSDDGEEVCHLAFSNNNLCAFIVQDISLIRIQPNF